tara:strand:+ start:6694 stop:7152 length:459 start_codon:yes stop_codon:yes gene_type:complete
MINNELFLGILFCIFVLLSPLLAIVERLFLGLGIVLITFCLGILLLSTPILFLSGVFLIIASEATVTNGLYYILFGITSPFILVPLFLFFCNLIEDDASFIESSYAIPLANIILVLLAFMIFGTSSIYFTVVIVLSSVLIAGDFTMTKLINS